MSREQWTLDELLSPARMAPYLAARAADRDRALALYDWNSRVSAAFFESLHLLEVGLRNAIDLTASRRIGPDWLGPASPVLTPRSRRAVAVALRHAGGAAVPRGKIVAELPFGFWWSLLSDEYNRRLWQPAVQHAFDRQVRRRRLHAELDELRRLRNRIAHHEPIHHRALGADYERLIDVAGRIASALGDHIASTSRIPELLAADAA